MEHGILDNPRTYETVEIFFENYKILKIFRVWTCPVKELISRLHEFLMFGILNSSFTRRCPYRYSRVSLHDGICSINRASNIEDSSEFSFSILYGISRYSTAEQILFVVLSRYFR